MTGFEHATTLSRHVLRQQRIALPTWIAAVALFATVTASAFAKLYPTAESLAQITRQMSSAPAFVAMIGPIRAPNLGALVSWRFAIQGEIIVALMSVFTLIRHTRQDEEAGCAELVGAASVGRHAQLAAAMAVTLGANLCAGLLAALVLSTQSLSPIGALALGLSIAGYGAVCTTLAAVCAQLFESASGAKRAAGISLLAMYLLRLVGDASQVAMPQSSLTVFSWISPAGWVHQVRPFAGEQWWVLGLFVALSALLGALSFALASRRDLGAGMVRPQTGSAHASRWLSSELGLGWRLHRATFYGWILGLSIVGLVLGAVAQVGAAALDNPQVRTLLSRMSASPSPVATIIHMSLAMIGPFVALFAMQATLRMQSEESGARTELLLSGPVSRVRLAQSHLLVALGGSAVALLVLGAGLTLAYALAGDSRDSVMAVAPWRILVGAIVYVPGVWIFAGIAMLQHGWMPRLTIFCWGVWVSVVMIDIFGPELRERVHLHQSPSPFSHVPNVLLGDAVRVGPLVLQLVVAAVLLACGVVGLRRRDLG